MVSEKGKIIRMDLYCHFCLKAKLKARITSQTLTIKCQNPDCLLGGKWEIPPYFHKGHNYFPNWEGLGLDVYELMYEEHSRTIRERAQDYWSSKCTHCDSSNIEIRRVGPWYNMHCKSCGHSSGGIPLEAWSLPEGISFLKNHHKLRVGFVEHPLLVDKNQCWAITYTDLQKNQRLLIYADLQTFQPIKSVIEYNAKAIQDEKTINELIRDIKC